MIAPVLEEVPAIVYRRQILGFFIRFQRYLDGYWFDSFKSTNAFEHSFFSYRGRRNTVIAPIVGATCSLYRGGPVGDLYSA